MADVVVIEDAPDAAPEPAAVVTQSETSEAELDLARRVGELTARLEAFERRLDETAATATVASSTAETAIDVAADAAETAADAIDEAVAADEAAEEAADEAAEPETHDEPVEPDTAPAREHVLHRKFLHFGKGD